ncbi:MAG: tRNA dihydrouridine(20/20a) synthase DusA [Pararhizobium sp.]
MNRYPKHRLAVAPMMDWTDVHCRALHRLLTRHTLLYTEMVVAEAAIRGDRQRLLAYAPDQHPIALQLGGSEPARLAEAARIGADFGYDEVNLNVGCPSDRVQSGTFGACLMREPGLVADCVAAMKRAVAIPVTVKCRLGVDEQDPETALSELADKVFAAGADALWVHARKAWLQGLSPKENRELPPLDYDRVHRLKADWPDRFIGINGGIRTLDAAEAELRVVDGVMLGRAAYHNAAILADVDRRIYGDGARGAIDWGDVRDRMMEHAARHIGSGGRLVHVTRHMVGLFQGIAGARRYRQVLSSAGARANAGPEVIAEAFAALDFDSDAAAAA